MTTSILNDCLLLKDSPFEKTREYLKTINLTIFDIIISKYKEVESHQIILYILCAYSEDSPLLILRQDNKEEKEGICEYLQIPEFKRNLLVNLTDMDIRHAVTKYVHTFAGPLFRSLKFLQIQYNDIELDITNRAAIVKKTETGEEGEDVITETFDYKEHGKSITELARLARTIDNLEKQIKLQVKRIEGLDDLREFGRTAKESGKIKGIRQGNVETAIKN